MGAHTHCRVCKASLPEPFLDLGLQPAANNLCRTTEEEFPVFPLAVTRCSTCGLVQLNHNVDPRFLFSAYLYATGVSKTFQKHFEDLARTLDHDVGGPGERGLVVDIGSNDGTLLAKFKALGWLVMGVDPAENLAAAAKVNGIPTITGFWNEAIASEIRYEFSAARLITANNVFAHLDDIRGFLRAVRVLLDKRGYFVCEVVSLEKMLAARTWDLLYHEHVTTWSVAPMERLFAEEGLQIVRVQDVASHGGSLRIWARVSGSKDCLMQERIANEKSTTGEEACRDFGRRAQDLKQQILQTIRNLRHDGRVVVGYGAPAKATVICNYLGLTGDDLDYIVDDNPLKAGRFMPVKGKYIPIVSSEWLLEHPPHTVVCFPWNLQADILPKLAGKCMQVLIPMPTLQIIPA